MIPDFQKIVEVRQKTPPAAILYSAQSRILFRERSFLKEETGSNPKAQYQGSTQSAAIHPNQTATILCKRSC